MAEVVELCTEETIPDLETMMPLLFNKQEIQDVTRTRRDYETKLRRTPKRIDDYMRYVEFEVNFMRAIMSRIKRKGGLLLQESAKLKWSLSNRSIRRFNMTIQYFPSDLNVWMTYIRFCKQMGFIPLVSQILEQLLKVHGSSRPEMFKLAANVALTDCKSVVKARQYLLSGLQIHKDNKMLLAEAFRVDLIDIDMRRKICLEIQIEINPRNPYLTSKKAEIFYDLYIKKVNDLELMNELLNICAEFDFTNQLEGKIKSDMHRHSGDERMWDILARRELNSDEKSSPKDKIKKCIALFDMGVKTLNTPRMWELYIDTLNKINEDKRVLPNYRRNLLVTALQKCRRSRKLSEQHYLLWQVHRLLGGEKHKKLVEVLRGAVTRLPESAELWQTLLQAHLTSGEDEAATHVLDAGTKVLGGRSLPLWKLMLQFEQTKPNNKAEEIFKKSWSQCPEISGGLRPMYLEWLVLTADIAVARKTFDEMMHGQCTPTLETYHKMIYLESIQPTPRKDRIVETYTLACHQFGKTNVDVWVDLYKFVFKTDFIKEKEIKPISN